MCFNDLFNYISGNNNKKKNIAMTVPVLNDFHDGRPTISFVMPKEYGENDLPEPADSNIRIEQIAGNLVAAIRFSGVFSMTKVEKMTNRLSNWIDSNGYKRVSAPRWARYNAPFTPPFMRRNEIHLEIEKA